MAEFQTLAGAVVSISAGNPATDDQAGYEALTFTTVGLVETVPDMGRVYTVVTFSPLGERGVLKAKGSFDEGAGDIVMAMKRSDAGQALMKTASESDNNYSFKFAYQDGRVKYVQALTTSSNDNGGGTDDVAKVTSNVAFNSSFVEVAAP